MSSFAFWGIIKHNGIEYVFANQTSFRRITKILRYIWALWEPYGSGHETVAVLLPGFAIKWLQNQVTRQPQFRDLTLNCHIVKPQACVHVGSCHVMITNVVPCQDEVSRRSIPCKTAYICWKAKRLNNNPENKVHGAPCWPHESCYQGNLA